MDQSTLLVRAHSLGLLAPFNRATESIHLICPLRTTDMGHIFNNMYNLKLGITATH